MKNLLIYTGANKKLSTEDETLAKIQIDNSISLGWNVKDLIFATDFSFEYKGIKSINLPDGLYYEFDKNANKIPVLIYLIKNGLINDKEVFWCHDLDAFENIKIIESDLQLDYFDIGLTHYTYKPEWQFGSFFFKTNALDIFEKIHAETLKKPHASRNNEKVLTKLIKDKKIDPKRYARLNPTYNFMKKYIQTIYSLSEKPLKIVHFRPSDSRDIFIQGKNRLKIPLVDERLVKIFAYHGIK